MQKSNWSLVGYGIGGAFALLSAVRYFLLWPDTDRAIVYVLIGFMICGLAWLYDKQLRLNNKLSAVEEYLADKK